MANETNRELLQKIQILEDMQSIPVPKSEYMGLDGKLKSDYKYTDEQEPYFVDDAEQTEKEVLNVDNSPDKTE